MDMKVVPASTEQGKSISWKKSGKAAVGAVVGGVMDSVVLTGSTLLRLPGSVHHISSAYVQAMRSIHHDTEHGPIRHAQAYAGTTLNFAGTTLILPPAVAIESVIVGLLYGAVTGGQEAYNNGIAASTRKVCDQARRMYKDPFKELKEHLEQPEA